MIRRTFMAAAAVVLIAGAAASTVALTAAPAYAQTAQSKALVDAAKAAGTVGEQSDGFLGFVAEGDAALRAAVAEINAGRAQVYREAAARSGATAQAAGASAYATVITGRLKPGEYYRPSDGAWVRK